MSQKQAKSEAQPSGREDATVHVFLPRKDADELKNALASFEAASEVVSGKPVPP